MQLPRVTRLAVLFAEGNPRLRGRKGAALHARAN